MNGAHGVLAFRGNVLYCEQRYAARRNVPLRSGAAGGRPGSR